MAFKITPQAIATAQKYAAGFAAAPKNTTGFRVTPAALKEAEAYSSPLHVAGRAIENSAMGAVNDINNLGGGLVHGASVPVAGAENLLGDAVSHVPLLGAVGNALQNVRPLQPMNYDPSSGFGIAGNITGQLAGPQGELDIASHTPSLIRAAAEKLPLSEAAIKAAINRTATNAGTGAVYAAPNHRLAGAVGGAAAGQVLDTAFHLPTHIANLGRMYVNHFLKTTAQDASQHLLGLRSPSEVGELNSQLGEMPVNFGEVVGNHALTNKTYNRTHVPFAGNKKVGAINAGMAVNEGQNLLDELGEQTPTAQIPSQIVQAVKANADKEQALSSAAYAARDKLALDNKVHVPLNNFKQAVADLKRKNAALWMQTPETKHAQSLIDGLMQPFAPKEIKAGAVIDPQSGKPFLGASVVHPPMEVPFAQAHFANSEIKDLGRSYDRQGNRHGKSLMTPLHVALSKDIDTALSAAPLTKAVHDAAQAHFKSTVLPYREKAIQNIIKGKSDLKSLNSTLLNSKHAKVLSDLPETIKNKILYNQLAGRVTKDANNQEVITPDALRNAVKSIGAETASRLISPEVQQKLARVNALNEVSREGKMRYSLPYTGMRAAEDAKKRTLQFAEVGGAGAMVKGGLLAKFLPAVIPPALYHNRKMTQLMYSPEIRRAYASGKGLKMLRPGRLNKSQNAIKKAAILGTDESIKNNEENP